MLTEPSGPDSAEDGSARSISPEAGPAVPDPVGVSPTERRRGSGRSVLAGLLLAAALVAISIGAVTVGRPAPIVPSAGSPTEAVETYAAAVLAGDWARAWASLSPKARQGWTYEDFSSMGALPSDMKQSLVVTGETVAGSSARVTAEFTMSFDPSMGGDSTQDGRDRPDPRRRGRLAHRRADVRPHARQRVLSGARR